MHPLSLRIQLRGVLLGDIVHSDFSVPSRAARASLMRILAIAAVGRSSLSACVSMAAMISGSNLTAIRPVFFSLLAIAGKIT